MFIHVYPFIHPADPYTQRFMAAFAASKQHPSDQHKIRQWCYETFGGAGYCADTNEIRWHDSIHFGEIEFNREEDLSLFLLKWGGN